MFLGSVFPFLSRKLKSNIIVLGLQNYAKIAHAV